jgi:hypothetical protein
MAEGERPLLNLKTGVRSTPQSVLTNLVAAPPISARNTFAQHPQQSFENLEPGGYLALETQVYNIHGIAVFCEHANCRLTAFELPLEFL